MKRKVYMLLALCISAGALFSSCEVDNYPEPDGTLTGTVIDATTNQGIITQQPNGFQIRYEETSWSDNPQPENFWVKPDGTFRNTKIFAGTYKVYPVQGPFLAVEPKTVEITSGGTTDVSFTVTPLVSFSNVSIVKEGNTIKATFRLTKNVAAATPSKYRVFATSLTPHVGATDGTFETGVSSPNTDLTEADFGVDKTVTISGSFVAGRTYYVRVGALCSGGDNSLNRYNLSPIVELKF